VAIIIGAVLVTVLIYLVYRDGYRVMAQRRSRKQARQQVQRILNSSPFRDMPNEQRISRGRRRKFRSGDEPAAGLDAASAEAREDLLTRQLLSGRITRSDYRRCMSDLAHGSSIPDYSHKPPSSQR
jgi:hypothetical protein